MRSKLAFSALVAASLVGSTFAASAQTSNGSGQGNVGPGSGQSEMKNGMTKSGSGITTGSGMNNGAGMNNGSGGMTKSTTANPSGQGNVGPGTNQAGSMGTSK